MTPFYLLHKANPMIDDTGWKPINIRSGDGDRQAKGNIEMISAAESRPCVMCRSWERDENKLITHLLAKGLEVQPDGTFKSPIRKDFKNSRANLSIDPKKFGFCRFDAFVTEDLSTCEKWTPVRTASELSNRIPKR